jgi:hypothetical protein
LNATDAAEAMPLEGRWAYGRERDLTDRYEEFKQRQERRAKAKAKSRSVSSIFGDDT